MLGDTRPLRIWGWLVAGILLVEALLHTPLGDRIPEGGKWGNDRLAKIVKEAAAYGEAGPVDVLFFGSSQGDTWVDVKDLRARGIRALNVSVPGGNTVLADLLGSQLFIPTLKPKLVVITLGPISLSSWNNNLVEAVNQSGVGGPVLRGDEITMWRNEHIMLIRKGGHPINAHTFNAVVRFFKGASAGRAEGLSQPSVPDRPPEMLPSSFRSQQREEAQFLALRHLQQFAESSGARVLFINMPLKDVEKEGAVWSYDDYLAELKRTTEGNPLLDLDAIADEAHFKDNVHPNQAGTGAMRLPIAEFVTLHVKGAEPK